jgi:hypothetical protein
MNMAKIQTTITKEVTGNERFWIGMLFGIFCTVLIGLSLDKIFSKDNYLPSAIDMPKDVITAYNMGIKDALKVNPPSTDLEYACAALWSNKQ